MRRTRTTVLSSSSSVAVVTMSLLLLLLLCGLLFAAMSPVHSMDHHKFNKCDQIGFCKRLRTYQPRYASHYRVVSSPGGQEAATATASSSTAWRALLQHTDVDPQQPSKKFHPNLWINVRAMKSTQGAVFRVSMHEEGVEMASSKDASAEHPRRRTTRDALVDESTVDLSIREYVHDNGQKATVITASPSSPTSTQGAVPELHVLHGDDRSAFKVLLKVDGEDSIVINEHSALNMESVVANANTKDDGAAAAAETSTTQEDDDNNKPASSTAAAGGDDDVIKNYEGAESAYAVDITFPSSEHIFGIPERAVDFNLKSTLNNAPYGGKSANFANNDNNSNNNNVVSEPYRMYNLDVFRYELDNTMGLYGAVPLLWSIQTSKPSKQGKKLQKPNFSAVLVLNPSETFVDVWRASGNSHSDKVLPAVGTHWISETGVLDMFLLPGGPSAHSVLRQYAQLTGSAPLPQLFSLGYHQCRWNYKDEEDVRTVDNMFDTHNMPYDVLWLDIEHTDSKKYFTWDSVLFPRPREMLRDMERKGRKMVTISDPHIKRHPGFHVHDEAQQRGYYVKNEHGTDYEGDCWPGRSSWLDYLNPTVRQYYAQLFSFDKYAGSAHNLYTWIDMNEPSVFSGPEITMDKHAMHHGGVQHREVHNQYGFYQSMATHEGHLQRRENEDRPFILSRSFFAGSQRYVAIWTGDNGCEWSHLAKSQPMLLTLGMSGIPYVGADVGGFFDNPEPDLLVRWYQTGAFFPFFRAHAHIETKRREPWLFGEDNLALIRSAVARRYRLLPLYYTLSYHAWLTGAPLMRPMMMEFAHDPVTHDMQDQFMIGSALLVKPVVEKDAVQSSVYLPTDSGGWYDFDSGALVGTTGTVTVSSPLHKGIPVLQRGGSIVPTKYRVRRSSAQMHHDPYTLHVALDTRDHAAVGDLYVDDGRSFAYKKGEYKYRQFRFQKRKEQSFSLDCMLGNHSSLIDSGALVNEPTQASPAYRVPNTVERVVIYGFPTKPSRVYIASTASVAATTNSVTMDSSIGAPVTGDGIALVRELHFHYDDKSRVLTVRKPDVLVADDWSIMFE